jgi:hypothetical protein
VTLIQTDDVSVEWLNDGQVVVYRLLSPRRSSLNAWSEQALQTMEAWPKDRPYRAIHDISQSGLGMLYCRNVQNDVLNVGVLPEARPQVEALLARYPNWSVSLAVVMAGSLSGQVHRFTHLPESGKNSINAKTFLVRPQALDWLLRQPAPKMMSYGALDGMDPRLARHVTPMVAYTSED